jgi:hypothetical protein
MVSGFILGDFGFHVANLELLGHFHELGRNLLARAAPRCCKVDHYELQESQKPRKETEKDAGKKQGEESDVLGCWDACKCSCACMCKHPTRPKADTRNPSRKP